MEVLELNGVTYVKANSIARELGYTADYVGQLCRSGKVDAQLVGRSWFVSDESIRSHKKSRYRNNKADTVKALKKDIATKPSRPSDAETTAVPVRVAAPHFYRKLSSSETKYTEDDSELIPVLTEKKQLGNPTEIEVRHADEKRLSIKKTHASYSLSPTELPKIRFKGSLSVTEEVDESESEETVNEVDTSIDQPVLEKDIPKDHAVADNTSELKLSNHKTMLRRSGVVAMTKMAKTGEDTHAAVPITKLTAEPAKTGRYTFVYLTASFMLAIALSAGFLLVENSVTITALETESTYVVNLSAALESIKGLKHSYLVLPIF